MLDGKIKGTKGWQTMIIISLSNMTQDLLTPSSALVSY